MHTNCMVTNKLNFYISYKWNYIIMWRNANKVHMEIKLNIFYRINLKLFRTIKTVFYDRNYFK